MNWGNNATDSPLPGSDLWQMVAWGQAGPWFSDDLKQAYFDDPAHIEFVQAVIDMRCKDRSIPQSGDSMGQGDAFRNQLVAMGIYHHSQTFFYKQEKKTFNFDVGLPPAGPKGQFNAAGCSGYTIPVKAQHPDEAWAFIKFLVSPANVTPMVKFKRWGAPIKESEQYLLPDDNIPANFKPVLYDPMLGQSQGPDEAHHLPAVPGRDAPDLEDRVRRDLQLRRRDDRRGRRSGPSRRSRRSSTRRGRRSRSHGPHSVPLPAGEGRTRMQPALPLRAGQRGVRGGHLASRTREPVGPSPGHRGPLRGRPARRA